MAGLVRRVWSGVRKASEELGIVYPSPASGQYVDLPVWSPTLSGPTTAWSNGVPVLDPGVPLHEYTAKDLRAGFVWRTQPNVRKVTTFIARSIGTIPFKLYERIADDDRAQVRDHLLARTLAHPTGRTGQGASAFRTALVLDSLIYDRWAALKVIQPDGELTLQRIPARLLGFKTDALDNVTKIRVWSRRPDNANQWGYRDYDPDMFIWGVGYNPESGSGLSPMQTLAELLAESAEAVRFRRQQWANGARITGWIERPIEADEQYGDGWDDAARTRFLADFDSRYRGKDASDPGGIPLLEEGMKLHEGKAFSPQDTMDLEGRKLAAIEVASFYHIAPELVGARQGNYSNVREYRQMLYRDSLGAYITGFEEAFNTQLLPDHADPTRFYIEAHVETKLRGSFEEQAEMKSKAIGVPWMSVNEGRALENRPRVEGGDVIARPVNYFYDDKDGPDPAEPGEPNDPEEPEEDTASLEKAVQRSRKARSIPVRAQVKVDKLVDAYRADLAKFAARQGRAVLSALGAKATLEEGPPPLASAWDSDRWDEELGRLMFTHLKRAAELEGALIAAMAGLDEFDPDQLDEWVRKTVKASAHPWNQATLDALAEAVTEPSEEEDWKKRAAAVFEEASDHRAELLAGAGIHAAVEFAKVDTGKRGGWNRKTWRTTSSDPRPEHAALDGETVHIDAAFSNGAQWPGDASLPVYERAGCQCVVELFRED